MGIAAYNRGSVAIRKSIAADDRPVEFVMMDLLNALEKYPDAGTPFDEILFINSHGGWFAECPKSGFGYWYATLHEAIRRWRVEIYAASNGAWRAKPTRVPA